MSEWQKGDLALCIRGGRLDWGVNLEWPRAGVLYTVVGLEKYTRLYLRLEGAPDNIDYGRNWGPIWGAVRFRKVTPPKADEFDREVIEAMTGAPVGEPA